MKTLPYTDIAIAITLVNVLFYKPYFEPYLLKVHK